MNPELFDKNTFILDVHLKSNSKKINSITDELLSEIGKIITIKNKPRSREIFKKLLLNLLLSYYKLRGLSYSRNKNNYTKISNFGQIWINYGRLIPIIDSMIELGYVESKKGYWDKTSQSGKQSIIWPSLKLISKFGEIANIVHPDIIQRDNTNKLIILKSEKDPKTKKRQTLKFKITKKIKKMEFSLTNYNKFIDKQSISVNLNGNTNVNFYYLLKSLYSNLINGKQSITDIILIDSNFKHNKNICNNKVFMDVNQYKNEIFNSNNSQYIKQINNNNKYTSTPQPPPLSSTHTKIQNINLYKKFLHSEDVLIFTFLNWIKYIITDVIMTSKWEKNKEFYLRNLSLGNIGIQKLEYIINSKNLYRVFNDNSFIKGGRFYGAIYQSIPSHLRENILINGESSVELDFDSLHVSMLYHQKGYEINEDLYESIEGTENRKVKKTAMLVAINAKDKVNVIKAIRKKFVEDGFNKDFLKDQFITSLLNRIKQAHSVISDDFGSGKGIKLQYLDSIITENILLNMVYENIPALTMHDSYIVPQKHEDRLKFHMENEYSKIFNFKPRISKK